MKAKKEKLKKNPVAQDLLERIRHLSAQVNEYNDMLFGVREKCKHNFIPHEPYDPKDEWFSSGCTCENCGLDGGWYCPKSPSGQCDYEQKDGSVDPDHCVWCGMPDERK